MNGSHPSPTTSETTIGTKLYYIVSRPEARTHPLVEESPISTISTLRDVRYAANEVSKYALGYCSVTRSSSAAELTKGIARGEGLEGRHLPSEHSGICPIRTQDDLCHDHRDLGSACGSQQRTHSSTAVAGSPMHSP